MRFNLVRTLLHFGTEADAIQGDALADEILAKPTDTRHIAATDDVWPWDFFGTWFNSRAYLDAAIRPRPAGIPGAHLVQLIRASLHYHLAVRLDSLDHARGGLPPRPGVSLLREAARAITPPIAAPRGRARGCSGARAPGGDVRARRSSVARACRVGRSRSALERRPRRAGGAMPPRIRQRPVLHA